MHAYGYNAGAALYSSRMITQLKLAVPEAVLFGDIGHAAYGTLVSAQSLPALLSPSESRFFLSFEPAELVTNIPQPPTCLTACRL